VQEYSAEEIIEGIKERDSRILDHIYENYIHLITDLVRQNSGTNEDAKDIYQDAILIIYQRVRKNELKLNCTFGTYIYSVCRLLWLKNLEKKKTERKYLDEKSNYIELDDNLLDIFEKNDRQKLYQYHFNKLSFKCQKILELSLAGISANEIARILNFKSEVYVRKRKHICKENLVSKIKMDHRYRELVKKD
jgi:RNA polymerase sigma factor (sigma-70 family)